MKEMGLCRENHTSYTGIEICTYYIEINEAVLDSLVLTVMPSGLHDNDVDRQVGRIIHEHMPKRTKHTCPL